MSYSLKMYVVFIKVRRFRAIPLNFRCIMLRHNDFFVRKCATKGCYAIYYYYIIGNKKRIINLSLEKEIEDGEACIHF